MTLQDVVDGFELQEDAAMQTSDEERWRAVVKLHPDGYRVFLMRYGLPDWSATNATLDGLVTSMPVVANPDRWTYARRFVRDHESADWPRLTMTLSGDTAITLDYSQPAVAQLRAAFVRYYHEEARAGDFDRMADAPLALRQADEALSDTSAAFATWGMRTGLDDDDLTRQEQAIRRLASREVRDREERLR